MSDRRGEPRRVQAAVSAFLTVTSVSSGRMIVASLAHIIYSVAAVPYGTRTARSAGG